MGRKINFIIGLLIISLFFTPIVYANSQSSIIYQNDPIYNSSKGDIFYVGGTGPNNYSMIQDAINDASSGDTIFVDSGIYYQQVIVNKMVELIGENKDSTIIDGSNSNNILKIEADGVIVKDFTIQYGAIGVYIVTSSNVQIKNNIIKKNWEGIGLLAVSNSEIKQNDILNNYFEGINPIQSSGNYFSKNIVNWNLYGFLIAESSGNFIFENEIRGNIRGIELTENSDNNKFYHNNFYSNDEDNAYDNCNNIWDDEYPSGGNYWDDYTGSDNDGDGIGDSSYNIPGDGNEDRYPLMSPWVGDENQPPNKPTITGPSNGKVGINYNYTVSTLDPDEDNIWYYIDWGDNTNTGWIGPFESGEDITQSHNWSIQDSYIIKCKVKDSEDAESDWQYLDVIIPKIRSYNFIFYRIISILSNMVDYLMSKITLA